ncbi:hypothetical protein BGX23_012347 [Mortierella sp. AD031]|nr:hypothetical protein BGX23_012347 [Mortierella sp. AD031]
MNFFSHTFVTGETSVVLVGNPGVGKSTILNALGGVFPTGFSAVSGLTRELSTARSIVDGRKLRLVDIPGIHDVQAGDEYAATQRHLDILRDTLNDGSSNVIFFVIAPNNGRISSSDFTVMTTLLNHLDSSPLVGLILNQVQSKDYDAIKASGYFESIQSVLRGSNADLTYFNTMGPLIIIDDDDSDDRGGLSPAAAVAIKNYVLSFEPKSVTARRMFVSIFMTILAALVEHAVAAITAN